MGVLRPDLVVSCGDLPFDYLEYVVTVANVPLLYVPGNHDPEVRRRAPDPVVGALTDRSLAFEGPEKPGAPEGCVNVDGRIVEAAGLKVGGLGGSIRYSGGPNQYTQAQMRRRARRLGLRARLRRGLDVLITHGAPLGVSDEDDPSHIGFAAFHRLVATARPKLLLHGHIHPHGEVRPDQAMGDTRVVNVIPFKLIEVRR
jgi:uncharacterized protein